jgi:HlyD family secretion protein
MKCVMSVKKWLLLLGVGILLVGVGGAGWVANHFWGIAETATQPRDLPNRQGGGEEGVVCTGYVDLEHGIRSLAPLRPGRVAEIVAKENQHVEAGAVILRLEDDDDALQVEAAEAAVTAAEVQLQEARKLKAQQQARLAQQQAAMRAAGFRLEAARQLLRHKEKQLKDNLIAAEDVDMTRGEVKALEQHERAENEKLAELNTVDPALAIRKAETQRKLSRIQRDRARHQLEECTLKAPAAGSVQHIAVGAGDIVTGNPAQPVVRFAPDEPPLVRAEVDQEFADRIQEGQTALIRDDTHTRTSWHGKVQRIAGWYKQRRPMTQDPSAFTDVRTVECLISIDPGQPPLRLGQRMRVIIGHVPSSGGD